MAIKTIKTFPALFCLMLFVAAVNAQNFMIDVSFNPAFGGRTSQFFDIINTVEVQPDQKILVGGNFTTANGDNSALIARFNSNGTRDSSFNSALGFEANDAVKVIKALPDGKMLVAGIFRVGGNLTYLTRLNSDGSVDVSFPPSGFANIKTMELLPGGKFFACGLALVRFNADGTEDSSFHVTLSGSGCYDVKPAPDGGAFVAGLFGSVNGEGTRGLVRLNADGTRNTSFNVPGGDVLSREFYRVVVLPDGNVIASSKYWYYNSQQDLMASGQVTRYDASGGATPFSNCTYVENYTTLFLVSDGKIVTNSCRPNSTSVSYQFGRLLPNGSFDASLTRIAFSDLVTSIARLANGDYVVGGSFSAVDGSPRQHVARLNAITHPTLGDFDGDGKTDISVFRPSEGIWYSHLSGGNYQFSWWGLSTDKPVAADYDGDGKTDVAVFRNGDWYIIRSSDSVFDFRTFGQTGDQPAAGDINGDGKTDMIYRHKVNNVVEWTFRYFGSASPSGTFFLSNELQGDIPVTGDFNGDGKTEVGFYRDGHWYSRNEIANSVTVHYLFGTTGDIPVPGDYDGDGRTDYALFRPSNGVWYIAKSSDSQFIISQFGISGDVPVPGDYDGDGKTDIGIYRNGLWFLQRSSLGFGGESWGLAGDIPIPAQSRF